jgi:hypothetical protein
MVRSVWLGVALAADPAALDAAAPAGEPNPPTARRRIPATMKNRLSIIAPLICFTWKTFRFQVP